MENLGVLSWNLKCVPKLPPWLGRSLTALTEGEALQIPRICWRNVQGGHKMMFIPFELQSSFVYSQKAPCFREKLDLPICADAGGNYRHISLHLMWSMSCQKCVFTGPVRLWWNGGLEHLFIFNSISRNSWKSLTKKMEESTKRQLTVWSPKSQL